MCKTIIQNNVKKCLNVFVIQCVKLVLRIFIWNVCYSIIFQETLCKSNTVTLVIVTSAIRFPISTYLKRPRWRQRCWLQGTRRSQCIKNPYVCHSFRTYKYKINKETMKFIPTFSKHEWSWKFTLWVLNWIGIIKRILQLPK